MSVNVYFQAGTVCTRADDIEIGPGLSITLMGNRVRIELDPVLQNLVNELRYGNRTCDALEDRVVVQKQNGDLALKRAHLPTVVDSPQGPVVHVGHVALVNEVSIKQLIGRPPQIDWVK